MNTFGQMGTVLKSARETLAPNINGMGAYEGGQLPGAINAATRIRTARAALNDTDPEILVELLTDTLTVRFGKVKASMILRDALAGVEK